MEKEVQERFEQMERTLNRHIEFVGAALTESARQIAELTKQVNRTAAAQEVTEELLQKLITRVDGHQERLDKIDGGEGKTR